MARIYNRNHYVMQLHIGTYLDANTSHVKSVGQSTGFDCCDDAAPVKGVGELLNNLTTIGELPKPSSTRWTAPRLRPGRS